MPVTAVVGAQFGSEGKGVIVNKIASQYEVHVRTGGPNAGHSFYHKGKRWAMQSVPCGWTNRSAQLVLGRGAVIHEATLQRELLALEKAGIRMKGRLLVDHNAVILQNRHQLAEGGTKGHLHKAIGSTGEGVGACRLDHLSRLVGSTLLAKNSKTRWLRETLADTVDFVNSADLQGADVLLEGTQGFGLSLVHGEWPYVTSRDTTAGTLAVDAGLPPSAITDVLLVARTYPIRVAGNSGPLEQETDWKTISERMGRSIEEHTTVTKKTRRIGAWDEQLFQRACLVNRPTRVAITFADYLDPEIEGKNKLTKTVRSFVQYAQTLAGVPVSYVGTGGKEWHVITL